MLPKVSIATRLTLALSLIASVVAIVEIFALSQMARVDSINQMEQISTPTSVALGQPSAGRAGNEAAAG